MSSGSLLVVDDEPSVAVTMGAILEMDGYTVTLSTSGADALAKLRGSVYDVVLTDLRLDDTDGLTIIGEVCRVQPDTVSIILTGYASLESAVKALREGAYDYLIKPCDVEELRVVVARAIERRQLGLQLKARMAELETANGTIRELNRDLQHRVERATAQLQQRMDDLARANEEIADLYRAAQANVEQLQELDRLKSRFLSMASHELKTPLTSISGLAQVLLRRMRRRLELGQPDSPEWDAEQRGHVDRLELLNSQTARLGRLVDELLDVSRIESGKIEFQWDRVDLARLIHDVAERLQMTTSQHTIAVQLDGVVESSVIADRDHLEQVLDNLVTNAIKFSPAGGTIRVRLRQRGDDMIVSVEDEGVGISPHQLDAVFGLFYQAEDPVSRRTGGMGLGLYISKDIITRHGGRIWAESKLNHGSTFSVLLPREPAASQLAPPPPQRSAATARARR
ncbi:MAG TPA: ATP-binding protein [Chloroflexota bacterium]|nr:ATP-binding protein [Chloroflexota bacterium]